MRCRLSCLIILRLPILGLITATGAMAVGNLVMPVRFVGVIKWRGSQTINLMGVQEFLSLSASRLDLWGSRLPNEEYYAGALLALDSKINEWTRAEMTVDFHVLAVLWNS